MWHKFLLWASKHYLRGRTGRRPPRPLDQLDVAAVHRVLLLNATALGDLLFYTPTFRAHDLLLSAVLAERCGRRSGAGRRVRQLRRLGDRINLARVDALEVLLDVSESGGSIDVEIERIGERFERIRGELDRLEQALTGGGRELGISRQYRNLAAAAAFVFAVAGAPGCHRVEAVDGAEPPDDADGSADTDVDVDSDSDSDVEPCEFVCVSPSLCEQIDGVVHEEAPCPDDDDVCCDWASDTDTDADSDSDADTDTDTSECSDDEYWQDFSELEELVFDNCDYWDHEPEILIHLDDNGEVADVEIEGGYGETEGWEDVLAECYLELLEGEEFPCLAGEQVWIYPYTMGIPE